ncbi:beta family protein [Vreelandella venusta]|uniref:beta family protein n=1 Tax=Vreelandella venusta TaxID=44935 RepID=UPI00200C09A7|nr:beta family protein [Halomonas venusta]UQI41436.1 beta family protein [Halomonas venusta]
MSNYVPFLKFKVNEVAALKALDNSLKEKITPFFDFPKKEDGTTEIKLKASVDASYRKYEINMKCLPFFYLDNYDIEDSLKIDGKNNYFYILEKFSNANFVPVVGIDRSDDRNNSVFYCKQRGFIKSNTVALRVSQDDFFSYDLVEDDIEDLLSKCEGVFDDLHLVIDNRVCGCDVKKTISEVNDFLVKINKSYRFSRIIFAGSSIPASIKDILDPNSEKTIIRKEVEIVKILKESFDIDFGDYTCVSPDYSDVKVEGGVFRRITAPKLFYPHDTEKLYIIRGGSLDSHPRGNKQYEDLCNIVVNKSFYRKKQNPSYSFGDDYLLHKSNSNGKDATPSTIPKPLINLHITYMMKDFMI